MKYLTSEVRWGTSHDPTYGFVKIIGLFMTELLDNCSFKLVVTVSASFCLLQLQVGFEV